MNDASILVATDFSETSHFAVHRAAMLARELGARVELVHVISEGSLERVQRLITSEVKDIDVQGTAARRLEVQQLADELASLYEVTIEVRVLHGPVVSLLAAQAEAADAELLVFGAPELGALRRWLVGSTPERALRDTMRAVLVVKQPPTSAYRRALVPVDLSLHAREAVHLARRIAPNADLVLLHVAEVPFEGKLVQGGIKDASLRALRESAAKEATQQLDDFVRQLDIRGVLVRTVVAHADISAAIVEQQGAHECDLIVMGKRGTSLLDKLMLGSTTQHVLSQATADVLVADRNQALQSDP